MYKNINIYYIGYITIKKKKNDFENICSVNPFYLIIVEVHGPIEETSRSKYLVFDSTDKNREILGKYTELCNGIKNEIKTINGGKEGEYGKYFIKIKFDADDNFSLNKPLKLHMLTVFVGPVYEEDGKFYQQVYLDECLYEL